MAFHISEFLCSLLHVCNTLTYLQVSFSTIHISKSAFSQTRGRVRHSGWRQTTHSGKLSTPESRILLCFSRLHQAPLAFLSTCSTVSEMTPDSCCSAVIQPQDELHCLQLFIWFHLGVRLSPCKAPFWHHYCLIIARNIQVFGSHHLSHLLHDFSHRCTLVLWMVTDSLQFFLACPIDWQKWALWLTSRKVICMKAREWFCEEKKDYLGELIFPAAEET